MAKNKEKELSSFEKTSGIVGAKESAGDHVFNVFNSILMILISIVIVYPLWYTVVASFTDPAVVNSGQFLIIPTKPFINGYKEALEYPRIWSGYGNTLLYTAVSVIVSLCCTIPGAYALSRMDMVGRRPIMFLFTFTMFFNGGMIPLYLVVRNLGLYNTMWALILPSAVSVYNLIVARSFFEGNLPIDLLEAAQLDGCSDFGFFFKIALPLSSTIIAVMVLFYATAMWNVYFNAIMFLQDQNKMPLQVILRDLVLSNSLTQGMSASELVEKQKLVDQLKYVIVTLAAFPLVIMYPFVQKYFAKGVMVGAVKG